MRALLLVVLALVLSAPLLAAPPEPAAPADLAPRYQAWLEEVAPLIDAKEKTAFLALQKDYQRDAFIRRFWDVRDPFPQTPVNELRARWEQHAGIARQRYGNMFDFGIIDPAKVTKAALDNAVSISGMELTTNCLVTDIKEENAAAGAGAGAGMY